MPRQHNAVFDRCAAPLPQAHKKRQEKGKARQGVAEKQRDDRS